MNDLIGVIGGMGPYAGLDLVRKIFDATTAQADQDHLPVALLSCSGALPDRSRFLDGCSDENPAEAIAEVALRLSAMGAVVAGMPCNTAHAPAIFDPVLATLEARGCPLRLLHMIDVAVEAVGARTSGLQRIGVLSTAAVHRLGLYRTRLEAAGLEPVLPEADVQERLVSPAIYDPVWGIKAQSHPVTPQARQCLIEAIDHLARRGAEAVILGCTELPLAVPEPRLGALTVIDPTAALARALIRETYPSKLRSP